MTKDNHALSQAKSQLDSIIEMIKVLHEAEEADEFAIYEGEEVTADDMRERISEDPLEVGRLNQYFILLCTGGPAVRIIGNLGEHNEPETATLQYQDWGTSWTNYPLNGLEEDLLLEYAQSFYFDEV